MQLLSALSRLAISCQRRVLVALSGHERLARRLGVKIGVGCRISSPNWGSEPYLVEIGDYVHITSGVNFVTHDGGVWVFRREFPSMDVLGRIVVGDGTYIGNNATILPGVQIGKGCVVGANSVVSRSIPNGVVAAGNPARFICWTEEYRGKMIPHDFGTHGVSRSEKQERVLGMVKLRGVQKPQIALPSVPGLQ